MKPPIPLRTAIDIGALVHSDPCDRSIVLGSFWPNSRRSFESRLVKTFKACCPVSDYEPHISALGRFYTQLIVERLGEERFDWVVRVLGSREETAERTRPQSLLVDMLCSATGARNGCDLFFRNGCRPPMRTVGRLSGPEALKARMQYIVQDVFLRPRHITGRVLLIDDICNTGASMRVCAHALKHIAGAERICTVNLAATRFNGGKDGHGMLLLDTSGLAQWPSLAQVWVDQAQVFHTQQDCPAAQGNQATDALFMAERGNRPCPACVITAPARRGWCQIWRR